ncbi:hypothetical protein [Lentzea flava]|uniref:Uncharacterized protein n=1 Tax=Lentzea flava TaxID=103732 RepID=A0ABQ2V9M2_9PSEU|nr:hypothetical protein [Lentzea flava]MCP2204103.1 hypothetical protein [Lentzea flava]GGU74145.1 hypothetical protein GCM10010178_76940 [Lentzea flava]
MNSEFYLRLGLFGLCVGVLVGLVLWLVWRKNRKAERERLDELTAFAESLGGTVTYRRAGARPWSADLTRAMADEHGTFLKWLGRQSEPRFDHVLDFRRGRWQVRVSEASMEKATSTSTRTAQEVRIEVATADLVPLKIVRRRHSGSAAQERNWAGEMPVTVARDDDPLWMELKLPAFVDHEFVAFTSDLPEAAGVLNHQFLELLLDEMQLRNLTFESGIAYTVMDGPILPGVVLQTVDSMTALLDRVPGAQR